MINLSTSNFLTHKKNLKVKEIVKYWKETCVMCDKQKPKLIVKYWKETCVMCDKQKPKFLIFKEL